MKFHLFLQLPAVVLLLTLLGLAGFIVGQFGRLEFLIGSELKSVVESMSFKHLFQHLHFDFNKCSFL